mgnify:CR=1 FL=1
MTPGARIEAVIELLAGVWSAATPPDRLVDAYFRKRRYAGSSDRRAISERLYNVIRRRARLDWWLARTGTELEANARTRMIADLALSDKASPTQISEMFSGTRHCPATLSDAEMAVADALYGRPLSHAEMPRSAAFEYPEWMDASLNALWGNQLEAEIAALNRPAAVDLRVNTLKAMREQAETALAEAFVETQPTPLSPLGLRLTGHPRLGGVEALKKGLVEIQDEGSQLIALLVGAAPGMTVVDFCAGAGGKTLAMAATMGIDGQLIGSLTACDISGNRMERMLPRLRRAGAHRVTRQVVAAADDPWVAQNTGRADRVLADVPCTGTGTWRRNPEAKWRFTPTDLDDLRSKQQRIFNTAASLVKPGGRLIYATCSLLQEENEQQLAWFLEQQRGRFAPLAIEAVWAETIGGPAPGNGPSIRFSPASTGTDGFFCCVLECQE